MMRIKIADQEPFDILTKGFHLIKSPQIYGHDIKENNISRVDFPELDGEVVYIHPKPKLKAIEYTITLAFYAEDDTPPAKKVADFIKSLIGYQLTIFNDYKKVQFQAFYLSHKDGEFYNQKVVTFDITFLIPNPQNIIYG